MVSEVFLIAGATGVVMAVMMIDAVVVGLGYLATLHVRHARCLRTLAPALVSNLEIVIVIRLQSPRPTTGVGPGWYS